MQRKLADKVRRAFGEGICRIPPGFTHEEEAEIPPGCRLYRSQLGDLAVFVLLLMVGKSRGFTFEARWSLDGRYPPYEIPVSASEVDPRQGAIRAGDFLDGEDHWWLIKQSGDRGIREPVEEALSLLEGSVIDFLTSLSVRGKC